MPLYWILTDIDGTKSVSLTHKLLKLKPLTEEACNGLAVNKVRLLSHGVFYHFLDHSEKGGCLTSVWFTPWTAPCTAPKFLVLWLPYSSRSPSCSMPSSNTYPPSHPTTTFKFRRILLLLFCYSSFLTFCIFHIWGQNPSC